MIEFSMSYGVYALVSLLMMFIVFLYTYKEVGKLLKVNRGTWFKELEQKNRSKETIHGRKDKGIDVIIMKDKEISLIQCKNWKQDSKYKITHKLLKEFVGNTTAFLENNNKEAEGYKIKRLYITPHNILDNSAKYFLRDNRVVEYINIPMS
ncbi:MAG: hypothetical protein GQ570_12365 [Helicobacteraceae bacterium]|nr:hypothetical protein [Helicobacteraceae bacterium]